MEVTEVLLTELDAAERRYRELEAIRNRQWTQLIVQRELLRREGKIPEDAKCKHGHKLVYIYKNREGSRVCPECAKRHVREYRKFRELEV